MANSIELHRALALNDNDDTQLFTFLLSIGDVDTFRKNPARSALFYYQGHEWYLTCGGFDDKEGVPQLGVFLYWTGTNTVGLRCRSDYRIIVRNVQDPAESLISEGLQVLFNPPKSLGWGKRELGPLNEILSMSKGFLVEPNGSIIVELALKSGKTIFEQTVDISQVLEEPKQADNPFKSYFTPNFSLAGFEFYLSVYPFGDRQEADGHVSMYLHRYIKTGNPHLGCRIRYRFFIGGHLSPGDSKTFEFSFKNDHGYGRFKAFQPLSSTDVLRRGPVPVGVEILSITSYAQLELPLTTRGYYHTDNFVFEDVVFGDHRGNQWKLSVNNTAQVLCFRLDAEDKSKLSLKSAGKKEERCSKYLQSEILVQSRADRKKTMKPIGGSSTAYFSANLPDKTYSIAMPVAVAKAKALDGEYCTKEDPSLSVRVEMLNVQDLPGVMKDYPVLEFERFRLYHTREGLRKCLEQNEEMRKEIEKLQQQLSLVSSANTNQVDDLLATYPKPYENGALHVFTNTPVTNLNQSGSFPALSPVPVSSTPSFTTLTTSVTSSTPSLPTVTLPTHSASIPRAHSPTMRSHSPTPSAESSGPAQFVLLPGEEDSSERRAPPPASAKSSIPTSTGTSGAGGMNPKSYVAQSYVGVVNTSAKPPTFTVSNAPTPQIKLQPGFDLKPKTAIAQSYVGVVTPTARTSTPTTSVSSSITTAPKIRVQPGMDVKPKAGNVIAHSYVGVVNAPVSAPSKPTSYGFDDLDSMAVTTNVVSAHSTAISHSYHSGYSSSDSLERKPSPTAELYFHEYSRQRRSYAEALTTGDALDSIEFGMPESSSYMPPSSSFDTDIVSGDTAPPRRTYGEDPRANAPRTATHYSHEDGFSNERDHHSDNQVSYENINTTMQQNTRHQQQAVQQQSTRQAVEQQRSRQPVEQQSSRQPVVQQSSRQPVVQQSSRQPVVQQESLKHTTRPMSTNSTMHSSTQLPTNDYPSLRSTTSQKSVQFATELTKEYRVNTKKPISKSKKMPVTVNDSLKPTPKPILSSPKVTTAPPTFTTDTRTNYHMQTGGAPQQTNQKPSLANKAWAKPTIFAQMASTVQKKGSPSIERKPVPQAQVSNPMHRAHAQILTTGRAPAQQAESNNGYLAPDRSANVGRPAQRSTLPPNWTPSYPGQAASDSSNPSLEDLHLYTMPDLDYPPALPPRNGEKSKQAPRIMPSLGPNPSRLSSRSASSLPRSTAFGPPVSQSGSGLERRTLSNQALTGHLARSSPTPSSQSIETQVSTRRETETTFGSVAETAHTSRLMPQAQVAHTGRRTSPSVSSSHVGVIETNL